MLKKPAFAGVFCIVNVLLISHEIVNKLLIFLCLCCMNFNLLTESVGFYNLVMKVKGKK